MPVSLNLKMDLLNFIVMENKIQLWSAPAVSAETYNDITVAVNHSDISNLTDQQKNQIIAAFQAGAYDMATGYTWNKAMVKLKELLGSLGGDFISDMLQRNDINDFSSIENVLSDIDAILLSEKLGILSSEGAMQLRHAKEQLSFYFSTQAEEQSAQLGPIHALAIIADSVKHILSIESGNLNLEFSSFKKQLLDNSLKESDSLYGRIIESSLFYLRTVCTILLSSIKKDTGAHVENASANLITILPEIWSKLSDEDKWNIGSVYKDVVADGNSVAVSSIRQALIKVKGFDYVPENLRSETFKKAAQKLIDVHYGYNNFYNEPFAVNALASLGTVIPKPAFHICIRAYLLSYLGNCYGVSISAQDRVIEELKKIHVERWIYFWMEQIHQDSNVLYHLLNENQVDRMRDLMIQIGLTEIQDLQLENKRLFEAIIKGQRSSATQIARTLYYKLSGK